MDFNKIINYAVECVTKNYANFNGRARRAEYEKDIPGVYEILQAGCEAARATAGATMREMKDAMRINYFDDAELISAKAREYGKA